MADLCGLILAGALSEEDDLAYRLQGRSRYAMPLANRALVRYAAEALIACGVEDIAIAVSPTTIEDVGEVLSDGPRFSARFRYLELCDGSTAAETLLAARDALPSKPLVVHSGDALVTSGLAGVLTDFSNARPGVLLVSEPSHSYPEAMVVGSRGVARRDEQLGGLDHVSPAAIVSVDALRELDGFAADTITLGGTVAALAEAGVNVLSRAIEGCWCYSGDGDHLLEANRMILDELAHGRPELEFDSSRIEGRVAIHPSARLERTTVRGPAVIGGDAELIDTFIGPYTSIGAGAKLEGAEIEHSIILGGASINHLGHRLEASIVGTGAEISRDFGMPAAVRVQVGRDSVVRLA